jgi:AcrR family transcriptional regulator
VTTATTRDRILDTSVKLFADKGFAQTSLRAITAEAGVNLAAVNYHFGSKDALILAVFERILDPVNQARLGLLDEAEARGESPDLRTVIRAFVAPPLQKMPHQRGPQVVRLFGRLYMEATPEVRAGVLRQFDEVFQRFADALQRAAPHLDAATVSCRFHLMVGAMVHAMSNWHLLKEAPPQRSCALDPPTMLEHLVDFVAAGFEAPPGASPTGEAGAEPFEQDHLLEEK